MDATDRPGTPDLEFDAVPGAAPVRLRPVDVAGSQRLVVNPFGAVLGGLLWWRLVMLLYGGSMPPLFVLAAIAGPALLPYLVQYHCLDCGRTGSYPRRGRHACEAVMARVRADDRGAGGGLPSARSQWFAWAWAIAAATLLILVVG